jgi:hypothetical protein
MVVVAGDLAKWREVGVEGSDQGNFGVRDSGHGLFLQSGVSGDGFCSGNGLFNPTGAMPPGHQVVLQHL